MREKALQLLVDIDKIYEEVVNGNKNVLEKLDSLLLRVLDFDDESKEQDEIIVMVINNFSHKVNLLYKLLALNEEYITLEDLKAEYEKLEIKRFEVVNKYVIGMVNVDDIESFKDSLFKFKKRLYAIPISDNNILEIARMKSKTQHFETEVLEDEEVLKLAYANSNLVYRKVISE